MQGDRDISEPNQEGLAVLSPLDQAFLIASILLFVLLSFISGRIVWKSYLASRRHEYADYRFTLKKNHLHDSASVDSLRELRSDPAIASNRMPTGKRRDINSVPSDSTPTISTDLHKEEEHIASQSTGSEMRQRFFLLLFIASTIRLCSLISEIGTLSIIPEASPDQSEKLTDTHSALLSFGQWLLAIVIWIPSLLFVTMYGLVLLFWAQLCYSCWKRAYPWPRRIFFAFNVLLYSTFFMTITLTKSVGGFWRICDIVLGSIYLIGFFTILYYSLRLIWFFKSQQQDEECLLTLSGSQESGRTFHYRPRLSSMAGKSSPQQAVLRRITAVCVILCVLFVTKAIYLVGMGTGYLPSQEAKYHLPVGVHHIAFEFVMYFATEFVPCALLTFFTRKQEENPLDHLKFTPVAATVAGTYRSLNADSRKASSPAQAFGVRDESSEPLIAALQEKTFTGYQYQATSDSKRAIPGYF